MQNGTHRNGSSNGVNKNAATVNGHDPASSTGHDLLWDGLSPAVTNALGQPLDPGIVSRRKGRAGRTYSYLEGHVAISEANKVFGFGGWGYELVGDVTLRQIETVDPRTGEVRRVHVYSAPVRVTVPGAPPRIDVGFHTVAEETGEGHETACKGAVTDGLKRALRSFGDRFGNGLYGDQPPVSGSPRPERVPAQAGERTNQGRGASPSRKDRTRVPGAGVPGNHYDETPVRELRKRLVHLGVEQGFDEDQVRTAVVDRTGKSMDDLTAAELTPLVESATERLHQLRQPQAQEAA